MKALSSTLAFPLACLLGLALCGCHTSLENGKKPTPVTEADIVGLWVGLTEDSLDYFRLDLRVGGKGLCAYVYVHDDPRLLAVSRWETEAGRIEMSLTPLDDDPNQITRIAGTAHATVMELTVFGKNWSRRLVMRREEDIEERANLVKTRMDRHKAGAGHSRK